MRDLAWMDDALCAQVGPDLFHPEGPGAHYEGARKVCDRCPVQEPCGSYAAGLEVGAGIHSRHGMWGARSPEKRHRDARTTAEAVNS